MALPLRGEACRGESAVVAHLRARLSRNQVADASAGQVIVLDGAHARTDAMCSRLLARGVSVAAVDVDAPEVERRLRRASVAVFLLDSACAAQQSDRVLELVESLRSRHVATLVCGLPEGVRLPSEPLVEVVPRDASGDEIVGRVVALAQHAPRLKALDDELARMERFSRQMTRYFDAIDQEMRLASRLQRDFLPRQFPASDGVRFASVYRPASWVSGDLFDIAPIDDRRVGVAIADAMGHGTAAALITMFVRQFFVGRRIAAAGQEVVSPAAALSELSQCLAGQRLPDGQFITAAYGVLDVPARRLVVARGGHPHPVHIRRDGRIEEIQAGGGLLGFADLAPDFDEVQIDLERGDKVVFYTDGVEDLITAGRDDAAARPLYTPEFQEWSKLDAAGLAAAIESHLDHQAGSLNPNDDVTVVVMEMTA